ncbi:MAG: sulfite exporter TauE/SafE family protein [Eikenella sp.]|nr:sulfite exporter TauE/SafE family protein [Eikenella sp.]
MANFTFWHYLAIFLLGIAASIINITAAGGSNLTLPLMMAFGVPPDIANGSNRVGIFLQSLTGLRGFAKAGKMPTADLRGILLPTLAGGLLGALSAAFLPNSLLKPLLLGAMLAVAALMAFKPNLLLAGESRQAKTVKETPQAAAWLFAAGMYGGFVQAGVGFLMLPILVGLLHYDLVRGNALKIACTLCFTTVALTVFLANGQIWWGIALSLAAGNIIGAQLGVKLALSIPAERMRWLLFAMTLAAVVMAFLK